MKKENFLEILMASTPEEINKYIEQKGKSRKFVNVVTFTNAKEEENNETCNDC